MIRNEFLKSTLAILIVVITIVSLALIGGRSVLQGYFSDLATSLNAITVRSEKNNLLIERANERIHTARRVLGQYVYWPELITDISNIVPHTLLIDQLNVDSLKGSGSITGKADTREALLGFGESLRSLERIRTVNIPISQLTEKEDINFTIQIELVP